MDKGGRCQHVVFSPDCEGRNHIASWGCEEGESFSDPARLKAHILSFYKNLLGVPEKEIGFLGPWSDSEQVTEEENHSLIAPFSEEEVYQAITHSTWGR